MNKENEKRMLKNGVTHLMNKQTKAEASNRHNKEINLFRLMIQIDSSKVPYTNYKII
jgi:hypothetical protein